jgi:protoporphyrin/coproporphyrin ferrochelatase
MTVDARPGAILMTYGSPASLDRDGIRDYLTRVRRGREPDDELVDEFTKRYQLIDGSPLVEITEAQTAAVGDILGWPVEAGMRFSEPSIDGALARLADRGVTRVAAIVLSPQFSPLLMGGYADALDAAAGRLGRSAPEVVVAGPWHDEPAFIDALRQRLRSALAAAASSGDRTHVLMTAHSLPRRVADQEPEYLGQLRATAERVAAAAGLADKDWTFCWQSAGHEPGEWMTPDFADLMPEVAGSGCASVVVVPVQFLADHLETLYDIDIGAREQAEAAGLAFHRAPSLNDDPRLASALAAVAGRTLGMAAAAAPSRRTA